MMKRTLSILLILAMVLSLTTVPVFATGPSTVDALRTALGALVPDGSGNASITLGGNVIINEAFSFLKVADGGPVPNEVTALSIETGGYTLQFGVGDMTTDKAFEIPAYVNIVNSGGTGDDPVAVYGSTEARATLTVAGKIDDRRVDGSFTPVAVIMRGGNLIVETGGEVHGRYGIHAPNFEGPVSHVTIRGKVYGSLSTINMNGQGASLTVETGADIRGANPIELGSGASLTMTGGSVFSNRNIAIGLHANGGATGSLNISGGEVRGRLEDTSAESYVSIAGLSIVGEGATATVTSGAAISVTAGGAYVQAIGVVLNYGATLDFSGRLEVSHETPGENTLLWGVTSVASTVNILDGAVIDASEHGTGLRLSGSPGTMSGDAIDAPCGTMSGGRIVANRGIIISNGLRDTNYFVSGGDVVALGDAPVALQASSHSYTGSNVAALTISGGTFSTDSTHSGANGIPGMLVEASYTGAHIAINGGAFHTGVGDMFGRAKWGGTISLGTANPVASGSKDIWLEGDYTGGSPTVFKTSLDQADVSVHLVGSSAHVTHLNNVERNYTGVVGESRDIPGTAEESTLFEATDGNGNAITWNRDSFDINTPGEYAVTGTFDAHGAGMKPSLTVHKRIVLSNSPSGDSLEGTVRISGTEAVNATLTAIVDITNDTLENLRYQWFRIGAGEDDEWTEIAGATASSYTITEADIGMYLTVRVNSTTTGGLLYAIMSTDAIPNPAAVSPTPTPTAAPTQTPSTPSTPSGNPAVSPTATPTPAPTQVPGTTAASKIVATVAAGMTVEGTRSRATVPTTALDSALAQARSLPVPTASDPDEAIAQVAEINAETPAGTTSVEFSLPTASLKRLADEANLGIKLKTGIGEILFDADALRAMTASASDDISISIEHADTAAIPETARALVKDRPVYQFQVASAGEKISSFGGSRIQVSVPYVLQEGEQAESIVVYYIDATGNLIPVVGRYENGVVSFETTHFSHYTIAYKSVTFADVRDSDTYAAAVRFIAARDITLGDGKGNFLPNSNITRGEFMTMLMRAYGITPSKDDLADNFVDARDGFYSASVASAKKLAITNGIGGNRYNPDGEISRQEMQVLVHRTLRVLGKPVPGDGTGLSAATYSDYSQIAPWAKTTYDVFAKKNIALTSGAASRLNPTTPVLRSEMATLLHRMLK